MLHGTPALLCCVLQQRHSEAKADDTFGRGGVIDDILLTARDDEDEPSQFDFMGKAGGQRAGRRPSDHLREGKVA